MIKKIILVISASSLALTWVFSLREIRLQIGDYYFNHNQFDQATNWFEKVARKERITFQDRKTNDQNYEVLYVCKTVGQTENPRLYAKFLSQFLNNKQPKSLLLSEFHFRIGQIYLGKNMWYEATQRFRASSKFDKAFRNELQFQLSKMSEAHPELEYIHYALGEIYERENHIDGAMKEYTKVLQLVPTHCEVLTRLRKVYERKGLTKEARELDKKIIELTPQHRIEAHFGNKILFSGYDLKKGSAHNDKEMNLIITFYFKLLEPVDQNMDIYLHLNNLFTQKSIINTNMHFEEGKSYLWKREQVVKKGFDVFIPLKSSLNDFGIQIGLWDHKKIFASFDIHGLPL